MFTAKTVNLFPNPAGGRKKADDIHFWVKHAGELHRREHIFGRAGGLAGKKQVDKYIISFEKQRKHNFSY